MSNIIQLPQRPPQENLLQHTFDLYGEDIVDGVVPSSVGDKSRLPQIGRMYSFDQVDDSINTNYVNYNGLNSLGYKDWKIEFNIFPKFDNNFQYLFDSGGSSSRGIGMRTIDNTQGTQYIIIYSTPRADDTGNYQKAIDLDYKFLTGDYISIRYSKTTKLITVFVNDIDISVNLFNDRIISNTNDTTTSKSLVFGNTVGGSNPYGGSLKNIKVFSDNSTLDIFYKCEDTGLIAFDSSGNGNHGTKVNTDVLGANTFSYEGSDVPKSYQNEVGYSDGDGSDNNGLYIPRDESNPKFDVLGNPLQYKGRVSYPAHLVDSNCLSFDGVDDYVTFPLIVESQNIKIELYFKDATPLFSFLSSTIDNESYIRYMNANTIRVQGIVTGSLVDFTVPTINPNIWNKLTVLKTDNLVQVFINNIEAANQAIITSEFQYNRFGLLQNDIGTNFDFYDGKLYGLKIYNGVNLDLVLDLPCAEGAGNTVFDASGNNNHGTLINGVSWAKQDVYHYNHSQGYSLYQHNTDTVANPDIRVPLGVNPVITDYTKIKDVRPSQRNHNGAETKVDFNPYGAPELKGTITRALDKVISNNFYQSLYKKGESLFYSNLLSIDRIINYMNYKLEPETIAYNDYAIANNFEVRDISYIDSIYIKLKELNLLGNLRHWSSSLGGVKKDVNNAVSELLSLDLGRRNVIQPVGGAQPVLNGDYITYNGSSQWMYRNPQDLISSLPFSMGSFGIDQNISTIEEQTSFSQSNVSKNIFESVNAQNAFNNSSNRMPAPTYYPIGQEFQRNYNEDAVYTKESGKKIFGAVLYEGTNFYNYLNGITDSTPLNYTTIANFNEVDFFNISAINRSSGLILRVSKRVDTFVFDKVLTQTELDSLRSISQAKFNY